MIDTIKQLNIGQDIGEIRLKICYKCPLYSNAYGGICNNKLYLNIETNDISEIPKLGYKRGCGCLLKSKVSNPSMSCPLEKW